MSKLRSELAPKGISFSPSSFFISDKYATILTVVAYPKYIYPGYLSSLTNMSGIKVVVKHIPIPFEQMKNMLNKQVADLQDKYQNEKDQTIRERIRQDIESLQYFTSMIASSDSKTFDFQMHIMIMSILMLSPAAISSFLVIPLPYYHNMLTFILDMYDFFESQREYKWKGWCNRNVKK